MSRINNVEMGLAKVGISNLNYINKFKKQAISKLLEPVQPIKLNTAVPIVKLNKGSQINIRV